jgi:hypothetical protein
MGYASGVMASRRRARRRNKRGGWGRLVGSGLLVVLVLGVVGILGFGVWMRGYLRSPEFLDLVNTKMSKALGVEARFQELKWEGMHVQAPLCEIDGDAMIRRVEGEEFETELRMGALLRKQFRSSDFIGRSLHVELDVTKDAPVLPESSGAFEFPGLKVESLSGELDFGGPVMSCSGVRADVQPGSAAGSYDISLSHGSLKTPLALFPSGKLRTVRARAFGGRLYLTEAEFGVYESGRLNIVGEVGLEEGDYTFEGELRRVACAEMVPEDWKKRLLGTLESDFLVQGTGKNAPLVTGSLELREGIITALPVLDRLAAYADTSRFRRMALSRANLKYRQQGERLELTDIVIASDGLTRLEGDLTVVGDQLDGVFQFGLAPGILAHIPGAETKVFHPGREGLLWTPLRITGTLADPKEDLSKRMMAAAGVRMFEMAPETGLWVLKNSGRAAGDMARGILGQLNGGDDEGGGAAPSVVEQGADVVRDGVNGLFNLIPGVGRPPVPKPDELPDPEKGPDLED